MNRKKRTKISPRQLPFVSFILPTCNGKQLITRTLESIKNQSYPCEKIEVIVVDNASTDGTPRLIQQNFPWVKLITLLKNTGSAYPKGLGAKKAKGDYLLITDDDVVFEKNCLRELIGLALSDEEIGIATGKMLDLEPPHKLAIPGFRINHYLGYQPFDLSGADKIRECDWAPGACILISKKLIKKIGYFDNGYVFCGDDYDVCFQIKGMGYKIVYTPKAIFYHAFTRSKGKNGPTQENLFAHYRGKFRYALKNLTLFQIFTTFLSQITLGPIYTYLFFKNKTFLPTLKALKWNIEHFRQTMASRRKAEKIRATLKKNSGKMKIAILTEFLNPRSSLRAPIELAKRLSLNHQIIFYAYQPYADQESRKKLEKRGIKVILINPLKIPFLGRYLGSLKLLYHLKNDRPDTLSFHGSLPLFMAAKLSGLSLIKTYYGTQLNAYLERFVPGQKISFIDRILNFLGNQYLIFSEWLQFKLATKVVGISQYTAWEAKKLYRRKIPFVHLGADAESFQKISQQKRSPKKSQFIILSVSRITPYKGFHLLIQAVAEVQKKINVPLKLFLVGSPEKKNYLNYLKEIKTPGTEIIINASNKKLRQLYQNCHLYATADRYLFFGLPPLEAALFGKPALALNFCAAPEIIIHGKTGLLAKNLSDFEKSLIKLIQDKNLRERLGENAKKRVKNEFSWAKTAQNYERLFQRTIRV